MVALLVLGNLKKCQFSTSLNPETLVTSSAKHGNYFPDGHLAKQNSEDGLTDSQIPKLTPGAEQTLRYVLLSLYGKSSFRPLGMEKNQMLLSGIDRDLSCNEL